MVDLGGYDGKAGRLSEHDMISIGRLTGFWSLLKTYFGTSDRPDGAYH